MRGFYDDKALRTLTDAYRDALDALEPEPDAVIDKVRATFIGRTLFYLWDEGERRSCDLALAAIRAWRGVQMERHVA